MVMACLFTMTTGNGAPYHHGPFLLCAVLCERVLEERDGVKTAVRIVDRVVRTTVGREPLGEMAPFQHNLYLLVRLKSGIARGNIPFELRLEKPNGESDSLAQINPFFEGGPDRGVEIVAPLQLELSLTGLYWFDIILGDIRITRVPLQIIHNPISRPQQPGGDTPQTPPSS